MKLTKHQKNVLRILAFGGSIHHWWHETKEDVTLINDEDFFDIRLDTFRKLRDAELIAKTKSLHEDCDTYILSRLGEKKI